MSLELGVHGSGQTRTYNAHVFGSAGVAQVRVTGGQAELVVRHIEPPPTGLIHEVWLVKGKRAPQPTGALFSVTGNGDGSVDVPGNLHGVDRVMVTPESVGGSKRAHPPGGDHRAAHLNR